MWSHRPPSCTPTRSFRLWTELHQQPLPVVTVDDAIRLTRASRTACAAAMRQVVDGGALTRVGPGQYAAPRPPVESVDREGVLERRCERCLKPLTGRQARWGSLECAAKAKTARTTAERRASWDSVDLRCAYCGGKSRRTSIRSGRGLLAEVQAAGELRAEKARRNAENAPPRDG